MPGEAEADGWVACLFGCWDEAVAFVREAGACWRKAAKKVERKKGRCEVMLPLMDTLCGREIIVWSGRKDERRLRAWWDICARSRQTQSADGALAIAMLKLRFERGGTAVRRLLQAVPARDRKCRGP